ncbi:hypothetical protein BGK72_37415 [Streptomyces agglomeratus]|nr:hypothetical protein BGK72_37415 [Streptomyces agglomeratus]
MVLLAFAVLAVGLVGSVLLTVLRPVLRSVLLTVLRPVLRSVLLTVLRPVLRPVLLTVLRPVLRPVLLTVLRPVLRPVLLTVLRPVLRPGLRLGLRRSVVTAADGHRVGRRVGHGSDRRRPAVAGEADTGTEGGQPGDRHGYDCSALKLTHVKPFLTQAGRLA